MKFSPYLFFFFFFSYISIIAFPLNEALNDHFLLHVLEKNKLAESTAAQNNPKKMKETDEEVDLEKALQTSMAHNEDLLKICYIQQRENDQLKNEKITLTYLVGALLQKKEDDQTITSIHQLKKILKRTETTKGFFPLVAQLTYDAYCSAKNCPTIANYYAMQTINGMIHQNFESKRLHSLSDSLQEAAFKNIYLSTAPVVLSQFITGPLINTELKVANGWEFQTNYVILDQLHKSSYGQKIAEYTRFNNLSPEKQQFIKSIAAWLTAAYLRPYLVSNETIKQHVPQAIIDCDTKITEKLKGIILSDKKIDFDKKITPKFNKRHTI